VPLRPSRLPDSGGIFTFSNGVRMEKISRSVRQAKQAKFLDADCTCPYSPYSPYDDVAGPYRLYNDDVAVFYWLIVGESGGDTCPVDGKWYEDTWPNPWVPRVPHYWFMIGCIKIVWWSPRGSTPGPLPTPNDFARLPDRWATIGSCYIYPFEYI
jgi:hypothetical protein